MLKRYSTRNVCASIETSAIPGQIARIELERLNFHSKLFAHVKCVQNWLINDWILLTKIPSVTTMHFCCFYSLVEIAIRNEKNILSDYYVEIVYYPNEGKGMKSQAKSENMLKIYSKKRKRK